MKSALLFLLLCCASVSPASAQDWAMDGRDPVGYFSDGRAMAGRVDIATMWKGYVWHFVSEDNRARFEADPRRFAPAFNGFCPVNLADGRLVEGNPEIFAVIGQRLYLLRSDAARSQLMDQPAEVLSRARTAWAETRK